MGFPDRIERTVQISRPVEAVWEALTTAEGLASWFGEEATIDLRPGGTMSLRWSTGDPVDMRVEKVEPYTLFALTWPIEGLQSDDPRRTFVEFTLHPIDGGTELRVVEYGFAQLSDESHESSYKDHSDGWTRERELTAGGASPHADVPARRGTELATSARSRIPGGSARPGRTRGGRRFRCRPHM
jgi:uncharacterized protein YndB with AHSA1/START domain